MKWIFEDKLPQKPQREHFVRIELYSTCIVYEEDWTREKTHTKFLMEGFFCYFGDQTQFSHEITT